MKITLTISDIIERCLWDDYLYYVLNRGSEKVDIAKLIEDNEEFEISETDALVIGLLKCIETDNLSHRLNQYVQHFMTNRAFNIERKFYLNKKILIESIEKFNKKFPSEWKPDLIYSKRLEDVKDYNKYLIDSIDKLKITETTDNFGTHECVEVNHVKKILIHHH